MSGRHFQEPMNWQERCDESHPAGQGTSDGETLVRAQATLQHLAMAIERPSSAHVRLEAVI